MFSWRAFTVYRFEPLFGGLIILTCIGVTTKVRADDGYLSTWSEHGFSAESRSALADHLRKSVEAGEVPGGAILLMHHGDVIFRQSFGYGHIRRQTPFSVDSHFRAASISKSIIATLIVKLAADGVLRLDEPIDQMLPIAARLRLKSGRPPTRMPTLRECLHHSAGFRADDGPGTRPWLEWTHKGLTLAEVVEHEAEIPMSEEPCTKYAYSGIGYDFAGRVVEVVTGKPIDDVLQEQLCRPLGMTDTTYHPDPDVHDRLPSFYWRHRSDGKLVRRRNQPHVPTGEYKSVGGGIVTTLNDLGRLLLMHQNAGQVRGRQWIESKWLREMYVRKKPGSYYGLGFVLGPADENGQGQWIMHTGSSGTMFWLDRQRQVIGVIATQHHYSKGADMPESEKVIPVDAISWTKRTKAAFIDPVFGWDK